MVILAAGLSERMGAFKPLLPVGSSPAILRDIKTAVAAGVGDIIIVTGHSRIELERVLSANAPGVRTVFNRRFEEGMLSSVRAGVSALSADCAAFFLLPADCCAVSVETLKLLVGEIERDETNSVIYPVHKGVRGHPPLIPAQYADRILADSSIDGLRSILAPLPSIELETFDPGVLLDMDTPEDYAHILAYFGLPNYQSSG